MNNTDNFRHSVTKNLVYRILRGSIIGLVLGSAGGVVEWQIARLLAIYLSGVSDLGELLFMAVPIFTTPIVGLIIGFMASMIKRRGVLPVVGGIFGGAAKIAFIIMNTISFSLDLIPLVLLGVVLGTVIGQILQIIFVKKQPMTDLIKNLVCV